MSLIAFTYILSAFLFFFSYFLDSHADRNGANLTGLTMIAAFIALTIGVSANLLYVGNLVVSGIFFKVCLLCIAFFSITLLRFSFSIPYNSKHAFLDVLMVLFFIFALYLVFPGDLSIAWSSANGFDLTTKALIGNITASDCFQVVFIFGLPGLSILSMFARAISLQSRIYRQRLVFVAASIFIGIGSSFLLIQLSFTYFWALPLAPFGLGVLIILVYQSMSLTTLFDRSLALATVVSFVVLGIVFSAFSSLIAMLAIELIPSIALLSVVLVVITVLLLSARDKLEHRFARYARVGSDYETDLETGLDSIDYTSGGEAVIDKVVSLLARYAECTTVDILVSDDKGKMLTVFSSSNAKNEIPSGNKAIDFLVGNNESVILKTQAITKHVYADYKAELLKIYDLVHADALILLREGHRVVGVMLLGPKKRGADYTDYDYSVLTRLYSNFFLVMYYLKNIANESVVLTVDKEIEYSGQIITSIQENIDRIDHPKVDVDFITKSARKLGGDFIDFIKLGEDKYLFVMGDVSGKGLNASMSMVILKSVLRTFLTETGDFKQLIVKVNLFIKNNLPKGTFFAGVFGLMDFSSNTMFYINCGVPAMFLYTASYNNAIEIQGEGKVLGFVRDIGKYLKVKKMVLNPQDIILITTDGLLDSTNLRGERFGKDRVQRMLLDNRSYPANRMAQFLCDSLSDFVSRELEDDISVLVFKYLSRDKG
jgi:serine phosphatase RsbU (regulator of sigma subunit)